MKGLAIESGGGGRIDVGYRTPGLSKVLDARGKMELARELGMTVVEPQLVEREFASIDDAHAMAEATRAVGVRIASVGCEMPLTIPGATAELDERIEFALRHAQVLGATYVFSRVMAQPEGVDQRTAWRLLATNGRRVADRLGERGIKWAIEADPPCFVHTLERQRRALAEIAHENCYPNFDPTNLYVAGSEPLDAVAEYGTRIVSGHIKDGYFASVKRHGEMPVGKGELDYEAIFARMLERGVRATMFIEHCNAPDQVRTAAAHIADVIERVRQRIVIPA